MCELCGEDRSRGVREAITLSDDMKRFAANLSNMAHGSIQPHGESAAGMGNLARSIVRKLVELYV